MALSAIDQQDGFLTVLSGLLEMLIVEVLNNERLACPLVSQRIVKSATNGGAIVEVSIISKTGSNNAGGVFSLYNFMKLFF